MRSQPRTPNSSAGSSAEGNAGNSLGGSTTINETISSNNLLGIVSNSGNEMNQNDTNNGTNNSNSTNNNENINGHTQSGLLSSSNYIHISSLSPPRLNLNNGFSSAYGNMYPSIHPSIQVGDSYG